MIPNTSAASPVNQEMRENWVWTSGWGYVRLAPGADPNAVLAKFKTVIDRSVDPMKMDECQGTGQRCADAASHALCRCASFDRPVWRHDAAGKLDHGLWLFRHRRADPADACFNFTNLATARAMMRAREISLRKVVGARRAQLIVQFLGEALLTAVMALVLALALTEILLPLFDRVLGLPIEIHYLRDWPLLLFIIGSRRGGRTAQRRLSRAGAVGLPSGLDHAREQRRRPGRGPDCAPRWWCCSSRSPSALASPRR